MKKKQKSRVRSLRGTLLLLLLTAVLLVGSTYAWFTANQTVTVEQLEVNVAAQNGLQISADGNIWSALVKKSDMVTAASTYNTIINQFPATLSPVSTSGAVTSGKLNMFDGVTETNSTTGKYELTASASSTEATGTAGNFIAFDIFLKVEALTNIELTTTSGVTLSGNGAEGIQNAARIAFLVEGTQPNGTALGTIQGMNGASSSYIWEPNYDVHTAAAVQHASSTYGITTTQTGASRISYDGIKAAFNTAIPVEDANATEHASNFAATSIAYSTIDSFQSNVPIFQLQPGITKVRVYMWIEGQDVDCENSASGANVDFNLQITKSATQP